MEPSDQPVLFTIGHSTHPIEEFIALLRRHDITAVCDVRSAPYSRFNPQFRREALAASLKDAGIAYVYLGRELGARVEDPALLEDGRVSFAKVARSDLFRAGMERVGEGMRAYRVALMCAERDPIQCHRMILVTRDARRWFNVEARAIPAEPGSVRGSGVSAVDPGAGHEPCLAAADAGGSLTIAHIRADGSLESNEEAERRLLEAAGLPAGTLFEAEAAMIEEAYERVGRAMAWTPKG